MENKNNSLDRNQIIGFVIIAVIMVGFYLWKQTQPIL